MGVFVGILFVVFLLAVVLLNLSRDRGAGALSRPVAAPSSPQQVIHFQYQDRKGALSTRRVNRAMIDGAYLRCFDLAWREERAFRLDRVTAWGAGSAWIQRVAPPTARVYNPQHGYIRFVGFPADEQAPLEAIADHVGFIVRTDGRGTKKLSYLCCGAGATNVQRGRAAAYGVRLIDRAEFEQIVFGA
jgi:hypothetical protein